MTKMKLVETFENTPAISLVEDTPTTKNTRVDGKYIIGMIEGQFFKPDGMSRNGRWYPRSLWEKALNSADVKNRFNTSTMFGEIGHSDGPVEDLTLRNGCASHFIDKLWIDDKGRGMGRAYILNTPTGNLLKTYLGAGCKLKVSTRGEGMYKEGCEHDGCPVVDDETYDLQTADFVINPGFLETSAMLKEAYENCREQLKVNEVHTKTEGEKNMTLNIDAYVQELKEEKAKLAAQVSSLTEELKAKEKELLQKQFNESAEVKKLNEALAPYKKMKVSAKTLHETFKKAQVALKKEKAEKSKISEELKAYKDKCGSLADIDTATKFSSKSLKMVEEYQKYGTPQDFKEAKECLQKAMQSLKSLHEVAAKAEKMLPELVEARKLKKNSAKLLKETAQLKKNAKDALNLLEKNNIKPAKTVKKTVKNEALELSKKYHCTVESAAKLIRKNGVAKATKLVEAALSKRTSKTNKLPSSKKLVEEVAQLDKVTNIPAEKTAKDFLTPGMVKNYFNQQALGKEVTYPDINKIDGTKPQKGDAAKELLKKYTDKFEVEKAPEGLDKEITPAQAEAEAKKLLK